MSMVRRFEKLDFVADGLAKPQTTPEGFWRVEGRLARAGIQEYRRADGTICRELRMPEDVKASVPGFALAPLTNQHPAGMVTPQNAKALIAGAVGEPRFDGKWITAPLTIYDADAIAAVKAGRGQLSAGYTCELVEESGEWEGQKYDCKQVSIGVNHVALVDIARAGPEARIRLDASDAICGDIQGELVPPENHMVGLFADPKENQAMPHSFKLDGLDIQVADANQEELIKRSVKERDDAKTAEKTRADKAEADLAASKEVEKQLRAEIATLPQRADALAKETAALWETARKHLGENYAINGNDAVTLKRAIVKQYLPNVENHDKLDGGTLDSMYLAALSIGKDKKTEESTVVNTDSSVPSLSTPEAARQRMIERNKAAFVANKGA